MNLALVYFFFFLVRAALAAWTRKDVLGIIVCGGGWLVAQEAVLQKPSF